MLSLKSLPYDILPTLSLLLPKKHDRFADDRNFGHVEPSIALQYFNTSKQTPSITASSLDLFLTGIALSHIAQFSRRMSE
jgi:hypothetical protein